MYAKKCLQETSMKINSCKKWQKCSITMIFWPITTLTIIRCSKSGVTLEYWRNRDTFDVLSGMSVVFAKKTESSRSKLTSEASRTSEARNNSWGVWGAVSPPPQGGPGAAPEAFAILTILEPQTPYFQLVKDEKMKFHQTKIFIFEGWWFALVGFWQSSQQLKLRPPPPPSP